MPTHFLNLLFWHWLGLLFANIDSSVWFACDSVSRWTVLFNPWSSYPTRLTNEKTTMITSIASFPLCVNEVLLCKKDTKTFSLLLFSCIRVSVLLVAALLTRHSVHDERRTCAEHYACTIRHSKKYQLLTCIYAIALQQVSFLNYSQITYTWCPLPILTLLRHMKNMCILKL